MAPPFKFLLSGEAGFCAAARSRLVLGFLYVEAPAERTRVILRLRFRVEDPSTLVARILFRHDVLTPFL